MKVKYNQKKDELEITVSESGVNALFLIGLGLLKSFTEDLKRTVETKDDRKKA